MASGFDWESGAATSETGGSSTLRIAVGLGIIAAIGAGIAILQARERRLSKPELARLRFYRYLRELGRLES